MCTLVGEGPLKNLQPAGSLKITQQTRAAGKFVRQACSVCWWIGLWCSSACFPLYCHCISLCNSYIELKKEIKVPFGPLQRVETVSGIKMTFLAFGIEVPLPPVTFSAAWNSRVPLKRRWGRMTQGELSFWRAPVSSWSLPNWASTSLKVLLAEGPCHPVRGACRHGRQKGGLGFTVKIILSIVNKK